MAENENEYCAHVSGVDGPFMLVNCKELNIRSIDLQKDQVICHTNLEKGDRIRIKTASDNPKKILRIEPWSKPRTINGKITRLERSFALVDDRIIILSNLKNRIVDESVICTVIDGDYHKNGIHYTKRTIGVKSHFSSTPLKAQFKRAMPCGHGYMDAHYNIPDDLYEIITSKDSDKIIMTLNQILPNVPLTFENYESKMHSLLYVEEIEMKRTFASYNSRIGFQIENQQFFIACDNIDELRPPISKGDEIAATKRSDLRKWESFPDNLEYRYHGKVLKVLSDRFQIRFQDANFLNEYEPVEYFVQFDYCRTIFKRKHSGVDATLTKFDGEFLFPQKLNAKPRVLNVDLIDDELLLNDVPIPWFNAKLNEEQKEAVKEALRNECRPLPLIIFGPPGTGKTAVLVEVILQIYTHLPNSRILITTQSNNAANVVASRLLFSNEQIAKSMLRLVSNTTIDKNKVPEKLHDFSASITMNIEEIDSMNDEPSQIKRNQDMSYIKEFRIVISTCGGIGIALGKDISNGFFTHVFIDEAGQCNEPEALIPIALTDAKKASIIMAGDPLQLPPIVLSNHAKDRGLAESMLTRYINMYANIKTSQMKEVDDYDTRLVVKLNRNYRALPCILDFYSKQFYKSSLIPMISMNESAEAKLLKYLYHSGEVFPKSEKQKPFGVHFIDVDGENYRDKGKKSWKNFEEVKRICSFVAKLTANCISAEEIGIIAPYFQQVILLKKHLSQHKKLAIGTVEEFQGEEKKVIIISGTKTSGTDIGLKFVFCPKRLNTAISRAQVLVVVFAKASTFAGDPNWLDLINYCKENGTFNGKLRYVNEDDDGI